jgi:hypothetical protein
VGRFGWGLAHGEGITAAESIGPVEARPSETGRGDSASTEVKVAANE